MRAAVIVFAGLACLLLLPGLAQAWTAGVTVSPSRADAGATLTYTVTVENTYAQTLGVYDVVLHFDWQETGAGTTLYSETDPISIAVGDSRNFVGPVTIPRNATADTDHAVEVSITATEPGVLGGWSLLGRHEHVYDATIRVTRPLIPGAEVLLLVLVVIALVAVTRRR